MSVGALGERIAAELLSRKGFRIVCMNYRKKWGEIDIVAEKSNVVHFVEVKSVSVPDFSREKEYWPEELADTRKLAKVARTAALYMESTHDNREYQIDVIGVLVNKVTKAARCRVTEQAL